MRTRRSKPNLINSFDKIVGLLSFYGEGEEVLRAEVSITYPNFKKILAHQIWTNDGSKDLDSITEEIMDFCKEHNVDLIEIVDELLPMPNISHKRCPHCNGELVRVPWDD